MRCIRKNIIAEAYHGEQRRTHFRLEYPIKARPKILIDQKDEYEVIDISEDGIRFFGHPGRSFLPSQVVQATLQFREGERLETKGTVLRMDDMVVVLFLSEKIPYKRIVAEELYLRKTKFHPEDIRRVAGPFP